ncbi:MAG TPA: ferritin-like domain-containing protein [Oleiagrimonas sp.]|nr:ferritin-like domain-containing protein [Oleiagrimonas sp.]
MDDLHAAAKACLDCVDPTEKCRLTHAAWQGVLEGEVGVDPDAPAPQPLAAPGRPERPRLVSPRDLPKRSLASEAGRAALVHAVAHIEFNAINLAWDAVYRFRGMPADFYRDWAAVANDEARHFALVSQRLADMGVAYGDFDAHNGLWEMAEKTAHDDTARMALVPRVLEARGLDVTPGMIERFRGAGDTATVAVLEVILREEVAHVEAGTRWFHWCCARDGRAPESTFRELLATYMKGKPRGPFNLDARRQAGFADSELAWLQSSDA